MSKPCVEMRVLHVLLHEARPIGLQALARRCECDDGAVRSAMIELERSGCVIDHDPAQGVRLIEAGLGTFRDYLEEYAAPIEAADADATARQGIVEVYRQTASTQDAARRLIDRVGANADGAVIVTDVQSAGRGRLGRAWHSQPGRSLTFSRVVVTQRSARVAINRLVIASAIAVDHAVSSLCPHVADAIGIKWPNDLLLEGRKFAGILVETASLPDEPDRLAAIIGIGVNVAIDEGDLSRAGDDIAKNATSLRLHGCRIDRLAVLAACVRQLGEAIAAPDEPLVAQWKQRCMQLGRTIRLRCDGHELSGEVIDVDLEAGLVLRDQFGNLQHCPASTTTVLGDT